MINNAIIHQVYTKYAWVKDYIVLMIQFADNLYCANPTNKTVCLGAESPFHNIKALSSEDIEKAFSSS